MQRARVECDSCVKEIEDSRHHQTEGTCECDRCRSDFNVGFVVNRDTIGVDDETELNRLTKLLLRSQKQEVAKAKRKQEQLQEALNTSRMQNNAQSEQVTQLQRQIQQLEHTTTQVLPHITCRLCMFLSFLN